MQRFLLFTVGVQVFLLIFSSSPPAFDFFEPVDPPRAFQVVAHRGQTVSAPENTIPALADTIEAGFEWAEIDIRLTRDKQHVLLHDSTLDKTTDGSGPVREKTLAEVRELDAGSWFANRYGGTKVPTFPEVLDFCKGKINLNLDCKDADAALLVRQIREAEMERQVVVFGSTELLAEVRRLSEDDIPIQTGYDPKVSVAEWVKEHRPAAVEIRANRITPEMVKAFHEADVFVQAQALGERDTPEVWRSCIAMGVDWLITDRGHRLLATYFHDTAGGERPVKVTAHRGAKQFAPENTLAAYREAVELGVDYIEIDVRVTRDGRLVSIHDSKLDRTTNGTGPVNAISFAELRKLSAGAWFGNEYKDEKVPTIEEICILLNRMHKSNHKEVNLYVDCKDIDAAKLVDALRAHGKLDGAVFYGSPDVLETVRRHAPNAKLMPGLGDLDRLNPLAERLKPFAFDTRWSILSESMIDRAHKAQVQVFSDAMGEHENTKHYRQAIRWGIDTIQTDRILRVFRAIELSETPQ